MMSTTHPTTQFELSVVHRAYREYKNFCILDQAGIQARTAAVLFSSNGLYYPNTESEATRVLVDQDRFEWRYTLPLGIRRIILVRDVFKTWYLRGISEAIPNPFALLELLQRELAGWDVQMAGVSSGGYAAILFGCLMGARRVFSLAGQFSLEPLLQDSRQHQLNPVVVASADDLSLRQFLNLETHFNSQIPEIYYLSPTHSAVDEPHRQLARADPRIRIFDLNSEHHDANLLRPALRRLFQRPSTYLDSLIERTPALGWDPVELSRRLAGNRRHFAYLVRRRRDLFWK